MKDNVKILKGIFLFILIAWLIIFLVCYVWIMHEVDKLNNYKFTDDMILELKDIVGIKESNSFEPIHVILIDPYGPQYYNSYELEFVISKEDYEKNNLSFGSDGDYDTLDSGSKKEEKNGVYICYKKYSMVYDKENYIKLEKIYRTQRNIPLDDYTLDEVNTVIDNSVYEFTENQEQISDKWWEEFDKEVDNLDTNYFVIDFENYKQKDNDKNLFDTQISEIAEVGFTESAKRIAGEGAKNKETEIIVLEEIIPNNYFTRKYKEGDIQYSELKMNAYVVTRENEMGNGIKIYIDPTTGLIVGGEAFGD